MLLGISKNKRWRRYALIALCAIFIGLFASLGMPAIYEICGPNEYTHLKECAQYHLPQFIFIWAMGIGDAHNGLITAIATVFLTYITLRLADMERDSGNTTRAQLRAYVFVDKLSFERKGDALNLLFTLLNSGETPAKKVIWCSKIAFGKNPPIFDKPTPINPAPVTLPKGAPREVTALTKDIPKATLANYFDGNAKFWVWGFVSYEDQFGTAHKSHFRFVSNGGAEYDQDGFLHCEAGNDSD